MQTNLKEIIPDKDLIAFCGLYCGACRAYLKGKCPGCKKNVKATWCSVRTCCLENNLQSCADCKSIGLSECKKYNNFMSRAIGFLLNSDRKACIERIKVAGYDDFAIDMARNRRQTIKRR